MMVDDSVMMPIIREVTRMTMIKIATKNHQQFRCKFYLNFLINSSQYNNVKVILHLVGRDLMFMTLLVLLFTC